MLSSEAKFDLGDLKEKESVDYTKCRVNGDATETGLIRFFQPIEDIEKTRARYVIPENKESKHLSTPSLLLLTFLFQR